MRYSENFHLYLPEGSDFVSPEQFNGNFTVLDTKLKAVETQAYSHTHGIDDLTGVAEEGHKHSAEDINAGVLASARVPLLVDANRIVAKVGTYAENVITNQAGSRIVNIPFDRSLTARPKKVYLFISPTYNDEAQAGHPETAGGYKDVADIMMILMYNEQTTKFDAYIGTQMRPNSSQKDGYSYSLAYYEDVGREYSGLYSGLLSVMGKGSSDSDKYWVGTGGAAFFSVGYSLKTCSARRFRYDKTGVSFELANSGAESTTRFTVTGYAFG